MENPLHKPLTINTNLHPNPLKKNKHRTPKRNRLHALLFYHSLPIPRRTPRPSYTNLLRNSDRIRRIRINDNPIQKLRNKTKLSSNHPILNKHLSSIRNPIRNSQVLPKTFPQTINRNRRLQLRNDKPNPCPRRSPPSLTLRTNLYERSQNIFTRQTSRQIQKQKPKTIY